MQASLPPPDIKKRSSNQRRRRRRRPRNKKTLEDQEENAYQPRTQQRRDVSLTDLISEASALERQLVELSKNIDAATEDEIVYVRRHLQGIYRHILVHDLLFASHHRIDDKMWRLIFYPTIEEIRTKLRKLHPVTDQGKRPGLLKQLAQYLDMSFQYYRDMNSRIKNEYNVDVASIGVDLFRQSASTDEQVALVLQSNYICMGDLSRYRASQTIPHDDKKTADGYWRMAKDCYHRAIDASRTSGKPYSQLALVSVSSGSAIDVVWYYCMSLAMKHSSTVARDNLKAFYSKLRFSSSDEDAGAQPPKLVARFAESFLQIHKQTMFSNESLDTAQLSVPSSLCTSLAKIIYLAAKDPANEKPAASMLHIFKNTLTRVIGILVITVWNLGEQMKRKGSNSTQLQTLQGYLMAFGFKLFADLFKMMQSTWPPLKENMDADQAIRIEDLMDTAILPGVSIWCTFFFSNLPLMAQFCTVNANTEIRSGVRARESEKRQLIRAMQAFLSTVIAHPMFPDPVDHVLPITYPVSEDKVLLGVQPLARFHATVDFYKENGYEDEGSQARKQVRWGRVRELVKRLADSNAFDFVQYNKTEQKYSVIDENAKRQQQSRFMKALATQRLMEQVSSLEKNVNRMNLSSSPPVEEKPEVYTVVVDVTAFLDGLGKIKKWANQTLSAHRRSQRSILQVIVPLETIDALDMHKKGSSHMNMQARESIRYLDQKLRNDTKDIPTNASFLRTQKIAEKIDWAKEGESFWIGEETIHTDLIGDISSDEAAEEYDDDDDSITGSIAGSDVESVSSEDLFRSRRRQFDEDDEDSESSDEEEEEEEQEDSDEDTAHVKGENSTQTHHPEHDNGTVTFGEVPREYVAMLGCALYYLQQSPEMMVFVTNDEHLSWWAEMFGYRGQRLMVKTVDEWDKMVRSSLTK